MIDRRRKLPDEQGSGLQTTQDIRIPASGDRRHTFGLQIALTGAGATIDPVLLSTAALAVSLVLLTSHPETGRPATWGLLGSGFIVLILGLVRKSPWLLIFVFPVAVFAAGVVGPPDALNRSSIQSHPELSTLALIAYLASAMLHCGKKRKARTPGSAPLVRALAGLVFLAPLMVAATAILATPGFLSTYGRDAAGAQALALIAGLTALVAVFYLSVYVPMRSSRQARRMRARLIAGARARLRLAGLALAVEILAGLSFAFLALTTA